MVNLGQSCPAPPSNFPKDLSLHSRHHAATAESFAPIVLESKTGICDCDNHDVSNNQLSTVGIVMIGMSMYELQ